MSSAGQQLIAGRIPGERIATTEATADSAGFTGTETVIMSVVAPVVIGRTYRVRFTGIIALSAAGSDDAQIRLRQDGVAGTQLQQQFIKVHSSGFGWSSTVEAEFTAAATGNKTVVATGTRLSGALTFRLEAASDRPAYLYVDFIRG